MSINIFPSMNPNLRSKIISKPVEQMKEDVIFIRWWPLQIEVKIHLMIELSTIGTNFFFFFSTIEWHSDGINLFHWRTQKDINSEPLMDRNNHGMGYKVLNGQVVYIFSKSF